MTLPVVIRAPLSIGLGLSLVGGIVATIAGQVAVKLFGRLFGLKTAERRQDVGSYWFRRCMAFFWVTINPFWRVKVLNEFPFGKDEAALKKATNGGKLILMMNHLSNCDPWISSYVMNPYLSLRWVTKHANANLPIAGHCIKNAGDLLVHFVTKGKFDVHKGTTGPMLEKAKEYINRGVGLAVYPEAIRNLQPDGPLSEFKLGFFQVAIETGASILPMALSGTERAWPRGTWMMDMATIYVSWGSELITPKEGETAEQLRDRVRQVISDMRDVHPDRKAFLEQQKKKNE